ncbi:MAG: M12 family metallo-peptidase [Ferruginibacter sp.]
MNKLITLLLLITTVNSYGQDWAVKKMVMDKKATRNAFNTIPAFTITANKQLAKRGSYQQLQLNNSFTNQLMTQTPDAIRIAIPISSTETLQCDLVKFDLGNIKFTENNDQVIEHIKSPLTYHGIVAGEQNRNNVVLTVNDDYISLIATLQDKTIQITKADETVKNTYRLYNSDKIQFPSTPAYCGTPDIAFTIPPPTQKAFNNTKISAGPKCVNVFVDCFDSLYLWRGSNTQQTINYVYELFNAVATGYANEQVTVQISTVNVWTTKDPYRGNVRDSARDDLAAYYKDNFWGNICVGLDYSTASPRSGIASIGVVKGLPINTCQVYTVAANEFCYCDLNYTTIATVQDFPNGPNTTGAAIYLVMHEMGHLLGSRHTKWCGWKLTSNPDTYGALDSCGTNEGTCPKGPPPPANGATIMSYCVGNSTTSDFVGFNNGFGPLPGNAIRDFIANNACFPDCLACVSLPNKPKNDTLALKYNRNSFPLKKPGENPPVYINYYAGIKPPHVYRSFNNSKK